MRPLTACRPARRVARRLIACASLSALSFTALLSLAPAAHAGVFTTGFYDNGAYMSGSADEWLDRTSDVGAGMVRVHVTWASVAPATRPAVFNPASAAEPAYDWSEIDDAVRAASAKGIDVLLSADRAPAWAEGPGRSSTARAGTWRPDPAEFGSFAHALAERYSGNFPDPENAGAMLPAVDHFQAWNEPNLPTYLTPQWSSGNQPLSPGIYRQLLNTFYENVKAVSSDNKVVAAGTAPYGDAPGIWRMRPVFFMRTLLCLSGQDLRLAPCPDPARLDVVSHHPYSVGGPRTKAHHIDNAAVPDVHKIVRVLRRAEGTGRVLPSRRKRVWVTEFSWDSRPPDPQGVPAATHARWAEEAMYLFWKQGVDTAIWLLIRDSAPTPSYAETYQSGVFFQDGRRKPAFKAFRFPFVAERRSKTRVRVWGRALEDGTIRVQLKGKRGWRTVDRVQGLARRTFTTALRLRGRAKLRGVASWGTSLVWSQSK